MATLENRTIKLEYPDFSYHDIDQIKLFYNEDKDIYLASYFDKVLKTNTFTAFSRINGRLLNNPFILNLTQENVETVGIDKLSEKVQEIARDSIPVDIGILPDKISCLKTPYKSGKNVVQFNVYVDADGYTYYVSEGLVRRLGINAGTKKDGMVSVTPAQINDICNRTSNDAIRLEPCYKPLEMVQRDSAFKVLDDGNSLFITKALANKYGINHKFALRYNSLSWVKVTEKEINDIVDKSSGGLVRLTPTYEKIDRTKTVRKSSKSKDLNKSLKQDSKPNESSGQLKAGEFEVLEVSGSEYISFDLAKDFEIKSSERIIFNGKEYCKVSNDDVKKIVVMSFYSKSLLKRPLMAKHIIVEKNKIKDSSKTKNIDVKYCIVDGMFFIPKDLPKVTELDYMGKKIRIDGVIYVGVTNERFLQICNELSVSGYNVNTHEKEVVKVNKEKGKEMTK